MIGPHAQLQEAMFFGLLDPWEAEEIICVYGFYLRQYDYLMKRVVDHIAGDRTKYKSFLSDDEDCYSIEHCKISSILLPSTLSFSPFLSSRIL